MNDNKKIIEENLNDLIEELFMVHPKISYIDGYTTRTKKCTFYCSICDRYFKKSFNSILNKYKEPCPICRSIEYTVFSRMSKQTIYEYRRTNQKEFERYIYKYGLVAKLRRKLNIKDDYDSNIMYSIIKDDLKNSQNRGKAWTDEDCSKLKQYIDRGYTIKRIALLMKRTVNGIRAQLDNDYFIENYINK